MLAIGHGREDGSGRVLHCGLRQVGRRHGNTEALSGGPRLSAVYRLLPPCVLARASARGKLAYRYASAHALGRAHAWTRTRAQTDDNDYWDSAFQHKCNGTNMVDLWIKEASDEGIGRPARGYNSTCAGGSVMNGDGPCPAQCTAGPKGDHEWGGYEDALLEQELVKTIKRANLSQPLFVFWAPHAVHAPLQVPIASFLSRHRRRHVHIEPM